MRSRRPVNPDLPLVPMNEDDRFIIQTIYGTRVRYYAGGYAILVTVSLLQLLPMVGKNTPAIDYLYLTIPFIMPLTVLALVIFRMRVYPLWCDLRSGMKEKMMYTIVRKSHFPLTNQYYISFDDPRYMHYEVDAELFYSLHEGDVIPVYRARYSKHVFEKDGRFSIV